MKAAFLLKGSISKKTGRSNLPGVANNDDDFINYCANYNSIKKHIIDTNPNIEFDFYIHTWHPELEENLIHLYNPVDILTEHNTKFIDEIKNKTIDAGVDISNFGQTSHCLSIKRGIDLIKNSKKNYDIVVLYRLDLLLWKDMIIRNCKDNITINNFMDGNGDFHFIMNQRNAFEFSKIYDVISKNLQPIPHLIFKNYICNFMKVGYNMDNITAGIDQEVIRKLKLLLEDNRINNSILNSYNLTQEEVRSYSIGNF